MKKRSILLSVFAILTLLFCILPTSAVSASEADTRSIPIYLEGVSMGAATVLMAAGLPELPANVRGVIADSPYSSPEEIIRKVLPEVQKQL